MRIVANGCGWHLFNWSPFITIFATLFTSLGQVICLGIFIVESVFWTLTRGVYVEGKGYINLVSALLFENGNLRSSIITNIVIIMILIGVALMVVAVSVAMIKSQFATKDEDRNPKNTIIGVLKGLILIVAFPLIIYSMLLVSNAITDAICNYAKIDMTASNSIANRVFFVFSKCPADQRVNWYLADGTTPAFNFLCRESDFIKAFGESYRGLDAWHSLTSCGFVWCGGVGTGIDGNHVGFNGYSNIFAIAVGCIILVAMFKCVLLMGKRLFDITILYVVAPLPIACEPADEGKRFNIWKDIMASKIITAFGVAISFIVYMILLDSVRVLFEQMCKDAGSPFWVLDFSLDSAGKMRIGTLLTLSYIVILCAGAHALPTTYTMIAHLVSEQAGMLAGQDSQSVSEDMKLATMVVNTGMNAIIGGGKLLAFGKKNAGGGQSGGLQSANRLVRAGSSLRQNGIIGAPIKSATGGISNHFQNARANKIGNLQSTISANWGKNNDALNTAQKQFKSMTGRAMSSSDVAQFRKNEAEINAWIGEGK